MPFSVHGIRFRATDYHEGKPKEDPLRIMAQRLSSHKNILAVRDGEQVDDVLNEIAKRSPARANVVIIDESPISSLSEIGETTLIHYAEEKNPRRVLIIGALGAAIDEGLPRSREILSLITSLDLPETMEIIQRRSGYHLRLFGTLARDSKISFGNNRYYLNLTDQPGSEGEYERMRSAGHAVVRISGLANTKIMQKVSGLLKEDEDNVGLGVVVDGDGQGLIRPAFAHIWNIGSNFTELAN